MYIKKTLWAIAILGLIGAGCFAYYVSKTMFSPNTVFNNKEAYIYVNTGASYNEVREQIIPLLRDIGSFDALANRKQYVSYIIPGRFVIKKDMNNNEIINSIRSNNLPIKMAFNNQESLEKLAGRISNQIEADSLSLLKTMNDDLFLKKNGFSKETALGMYIPNSYEFYWNTSAKGFRDKMLKEYNSFWNESRRKKAKAANLSPNEVIALASIVQEESKKSDEQPRIAGVYINRLRKGIPLYADPTLKFAAYKLPQYKNTVIKRVLNVHKEIDSPYNTYMYAGLPPGLIGMPDISTINAVLNYEKHTYLYFVADAKHFGYHKFAKTLSQHNANAREYHRYLSSQGVYK